MGWFRPWGLFVLVLSLVALASCSGTSSLPDTGNQQQGPTLGSTTIPSIWDLDSVGGHGTSLIGGPGSFTRLGREYLENLVHNGSVDGDSLFLDSTLGDGDEHTAWAVYRFENLLGKRPQALNVLGSVGGLEQQYYVGIANYTTGSWEWFGPSSLPEFQIDLHESYSRYVTALGNMYFLVITEGGDQFTLDKSVLTYLEGDQQVLPGSPHELQASDGTFSDKVHITWGAGEGATSYEVYRRVTGSDGEWTLLGTTVHTEFDDTTAEAGTVYKYKARSHNDAGFSGYSNFDEGYRGDLPQGGDCPTGLQASDGTYTDKVRLEWSGTQGTMYTVWRKQDGMGDFTEIGQSDGLSFNDTTAVAGVTYIYKVSGMHLGEPCYSNTDSGFRADGNGGDACPVNLVATDGTYTDKVRLEWGGHAGSLYRIYRRVTESDQQFSQISATTQLSYNDTSAEAGVGYTYKVVLTVQDVEQCNDEDTGYRAGGSQQEGCPSGLGASDGVYVDKIRLEWAGNATFGYDIFRKVDGQGDFTHIGFVVGLSYNDTTAEQGVTYIYKVGLEQPGGFCYSNTDAGHLAAAPDDCPSNLSASDGTWEAGVHLEWSGNAATAYDVYRKLASGGDYSLIATTEQGLSYLDTSAELNTLYNYKVVKHNGDCHTNDDNGYRGQI